MNIRRINQRYLEPAAQSLMIAGIIALCQPWNMFIHRYGVTITLIGLVSFMITTKIPREEKVDETKET
jgi:hypothetical protein